MRAVNFVVVGCGRIGHRHASILQTLPNARLAAIVENEADKHEHLTNEFGVPVFSSIEKFAQHPIEIDVANICTPNGLHALHTTQALNLNYHVLCEKPLGIKSEECEKLIAQSRQKDKQVFCVMQNRYSPPSVWLKDTIPLLGNIYQIYINCFWNRNEDYYKESIWKGSLDLDGGPLYTQFSHFVDTLLWLFGDVQLMKASFTKHKLHGITQFEDTGSFSFKLKQGGEGQFNYTTAAYAQNLESSITIISEKGNIQVGGQYMEKVLFCNIEDYDFKSLPKAKAPNQYGSYTGSAANHQNVFENVIAYLNNIPAKITTVEEGLQVVKLIEKVYNMQEVRF